MNKLLFILLTITLSLACKDGADKVVPCQEITQGAPFDAAIHDQWCLPDESLKITFRSIVEDGRCNVAGINCIWPGRFVMDLLIEEEGSQPYVDTLATDETWKGDLALTNYTLSLLLVQPEQRSSFEIDTAKYQFQMVLE